MSLLPQFKKHYPTYLLGILIPAIVNFLTIPVFKNVLGKENFGYYVFYYSILIIINSSFAGGITQSIIRLHVDFSDRNSFYSKSIWLSILLQLIICLPIFFYIQFNLNQLIFSFLFFLSLFTANLYTTLLAITQANLLPKLSSFAEALRTIIFLGLALFLLIFYSQLNFLVSIFIALFTSYFASLVFLFYKNELSFSLVYHHFELIEVKKTGKIFFKYGGFLIGWFLFSYGISFGNRFILAHFIGKEGIGHYVASFDILNKSIVLILSPVLLSLFPLIVKAYSLGDEKSVKKFVNRLTVLEILLMIVAIIGFYIFGFSIISKIINTPETSEYYWIDVQIIISTFIWQFAMLQHKFLELQKKTGQMVLFVFFGFVASTCVDVILISNFGVRFASIGFLVGGLVYLSSILIYNRSSSKRGANALTINL